MGLFFRSPEPEAVPAPETENDEVDLVYKPLEKPAAGTVSQPEVPNDKSVSDEEKSVRYETVLKHFSQENLKFKVSTEADANEVELTPVEKAWLTKECFLRYLRACNWKVDAAIARLEDSLVWRREYGISNGIYGHKDQEKYEIAELKDKVLLPLTIEEEHTSGKQVLFGFDKGCRPCLFLSTGKENTKPSQRQVQFLIFMLEATINYMPQGQDKLALCVDFKDYPGVGLKRKPMPSVGVGRSVLHILQYHYPERLGRALFVNIPFVASVFLKLCWPFLDPYTKQKVLFDNPFSDFVPAEQLPKSYGGDVNFKFDLDKYWQGLLEIGQAKFDKYLERFFELGGTVGLSEVDLRSHEAVPEGLAESADPAVELVAPSLGATSVDHLVDEKTTIEDIKSQTLEVVDTK